VLVVTLVEVAVESVDEDAPTVVVIVTITAVVEVDELLVGVVALEVVSVVVDVAGVVDASVVSCIVEDFDEEVEGGIEVETIETVVLEVVKLDSDEVEFE